LGTIGREEAGKCRVVLHRRVPTADRAARSAGLAGELERTQIGLDRRAAHHDVDEHGSNALGDGRRHHAADDSPRVPISHYTVRAPDLLHECRLEQLPTIGERRVRGC
jgi:hypothetical protein